MVINSNINMKVNYTDGAFNALSESLFALCHIATNKGSAQSCAFAKLCMAIPCLSYNRFNNGNLPDFSISQQKTISHIDALKHFINAYSMPGTRESRADRRYWDTEAKKKHSAHNNIFIYSVKLEHLLVMDLYIKRQLYKGKPLPEIFNELKHMTESGYKPVAKRYSTKVFSAKKQLAESVQNKKVLNIDNCKLSVMLDGLYQTLNSDNSWYSQIISKKAASASIVQTAHSHLLKQLDNAKLLTNNLIDLTRIEKQLPLF